MKNKAATQTILLLGNTNVGKTVLFNFLCQQERKVANYPNTSISVGRGKFSHNNKNFSVIDTPGINDLVPESEDEIVSQKLLIEEIPNIIAEIADGKNLRHSLLLTLQIAEYKLPMLLNINMLDEARQKGISFNTTLLSSLLGIPVTETVATEGEGVNNFQSALPDAAISSYSIPYPKEIESALTMIEKLTEDIPISARAMGTAVLSGDKEILTFLQDKVDTEAVSKIISATQAKFNNSLQNIILGSRLQCVEKIVAASQSIEPPLKLPFSEKIGKWSRQLHTGIPLAILVVVAMYFFVGKFGAEWLVNLLEGKVFGEWLIPLTKNLVADFPSRLVREALVGEFGLISVGLTLSFGVVIPVLITFFFAFGFLEDSGYLPRLSILLDRILKKIGLNGKGLLPLIMGFSCVTMAILTTRVLDTKRERYIATLLLTFGFPCAPLLGVMLVILANLSFLATIVVFGIILGQIMFVGYLAGKIIPGPRSDFILEIPPLRIPKLKTLLKKTVWRVWWFSKEAIPCFLLATLFLFVLNELGILLLFEKWGKPILTDIVGLPPESIKVMIMALIRRESGAALLKQLFDAGKFDTVQTVVALLVMTFLTPCINTIIIIIKERGIKGALSIIGFVTPYALIIGAAVNFICRKFGIVF